MLAELVFKCGGGDIIDFDDRGGRALVVIVATAVRWVEVVFELAEDGT